MLHLLVDLGVQAFHTTYLITRHLITIGLEFRVIDETLNHVRFRVRMIDSSSLAIS